MKGNWLISLTFSLFAGVILFAGVAMGQVPTQDATSRNEPYSRLDLSKYPSLNERDDFLKPGTTPSSLELLPPPPKVGSAAFAADVAAYKAGIPIRSTARGQLAFHDANQTPEGISSAFSSVLGVQISPSVTPITYNIMYRMVGDLSDIAVDKAKQHYMRIRPFMYFKTRSCQSEQDEANMRVNGSYPSGHTAYGWGFALILAELVPEKQDAILRRGYDFGQSRVICGAHWQSDVDAGRIIGAAALARLHTLDSFNREMKAAKAELAALIQGGATKH